jgi:2-polyprenyl-6-methoxyphenol hydroxylase-like FAD-dependent oxidoreductase
LKKCGIKVEPFEILSKLTYVTGEIRFKRTENPDKPADIMNYYQAVLPERANAYILLRIKNRDENDLEDYIVTMTAQLGKDFHEPLTWEEYEETFKEKLPLAKDLEFHSYLAPMKDYKKRGSRWNKFENCGVKGFVALGDSLVSFNPVYGQGISTAAESVLLLNNLIRTLGPDSSLAPVFQSKIKDVLAFPWFISTINDLHFAESKHSEFAKFMSVLGGKFFRVLLRATLTETYVMNLFVKTIGMEEGYIETLFDPEFNYRLLFPSKAPAASDSELKTK